MNLVLIPPVRRTHSAGSDAAAHLPLIHFLLEAVYSFLVDSHLSKGMSRLLTDIIAITPIKVSVKYPAAAKLPIAALHHTVAAVVSPCTLNPSLNIMPAPKNPIPVTT